MINTMYIEILEDSRALRAILGLDRVNGVATVRKILFKYILLPINMLIMFNKVSPKTSSIRNDKYKNRKSEFNIDI